MPGIEVTNLKRADVPAAVGVLARGMRDNPVHVAAFGDDPERRRRQLERLFTALFRVIRAQQPLAAWDGGTLVGITGSLASPACSPTNVEQLRMLPTVVRMGPRTAARVNTWVSTWSKRDPAEPHWHLGPLSVDAHLQGRGIGSRIMEEWNRRLDEAGLAGYLETDKEQNVAFYERHGFEATGEEEVLGVPNWYMTRPARG